MTYITMVAQGHDTHRRTGML